MKLSLRKKLSFSFLAAVLGSLIIASLISNLMINKKFNNYLIAQHNLMIKSIVQNIVEMYNDKSNQLNINSDELTRYAENEQLFIEVRDNSNKVIYSTGNSYLQNNTMMSSHMMNFSGMGIGDYKETSFPLLKGNTKIGTSVIGYLGASYLNNGAIYFKAALNQSFIIASGIAFAFGLLISLIISKQISQPLLKITKTANAMRSGNLEVRSEADTNTLEIDQLSKSINYLAETLQQQEMLRKRLTSDMAHELRTPLTTLKTHIEAMQDGIWEATPERLEIFLDEVTRLSKLVDNLRNLAKLEETTLSLNKTSFNLSTEIKKIVDNFKPIFSKAGYTLKSDLSLELDVIMDRDKFVQIMQNLLSNSYKYLNADGEVRILLKQSDGNIVIEISDNGIGISEKDLPHIFERFYRSDLSRSKDTGGSGIGLTITKAIVEAHGGKISAESIPNEETIFTISFPVERITA